MAGQRTCDLQVAGSSCAPEEISEKQKDADVTVSTVRRGRDETRIRPRLKCKPPRSMYLNRDDLAAAVTAPSGIVHGETLVKMTESQLLALRRQARQYLAVIIIIIIIRKFITRT